MTTASLEIAPDRTALLTVEEASRRLRISRWKLYDLINHQQLETIKLGRRRLVPAKALTKLIAELRQEPM